MPTLITLKTERSVREIAERVYGSLSAESLDRAEKALLKANPHLRNTAALRPGAVVNVPAVRGLKARGDTSGQDPAGDLRKDLAEAVAGYRDQLAISLDARAGELDAQETLLKTREIAGAIKRAPGGAELAKRLTDTLRERAKAITEARKLQGPLFAKIAADLRDLDFG